MKRIWSNEELTEDWALQPDERKWIFTPIGLASTLSGRGAKTATLLKDGRVLLSGSQSEAELFDPRNGNV